MRKVPMMASTSLSQQFFSPASESVPSYSAQPPLASRRMRMALSDIHDMRQSLPSASIPHREAGIIPEFLARIWPDEAKSDRFQAFAGFAWDRFGDDLLGGDLTCLTTVQIQVLGQLEGQLIAASHASASLERNQARTFALGLIAQSQGNRLAIRFAKRALKDAPDWVKLDI